MCVTATNDSKVRRSALGVLVAVIVSSLLSLPAQASDSTATLSANGVTSKQIIAENNQPGTTEWRIKAKTSVTAVQGFAGTTYAQVGDTVNLYVNTHLPTFTATAFRMGWYQGLGARQIWQSPVTEGTVQPACPLDASVNMVSCSNWSPSIAMKITSAFVPGDYLIKLQAGPEAASYILLTVWDPNSTAAYVIMNRPLVEQGWNTYGGYSYYGGVGPCIIDQISYPPCNRARVVSFDRPYSLGSGSSDFLTNEYPLVALTEKEGLDVTYITDITLSEHPNFLLKHKALLSLDHDESWTYEERMAVQQATNAGVNVVYFGAAAMVRHVRLEPSRLGPDRQEVDYRNSGEDPLSSQGGSPNQITSNTWTNPPASWSPVSQIGVEYSGYLPIGTLTSMTINDASAWVYKNTGLSNGQQLPQVIGSDFDHVIASSETPANISVFAHSLIPGATATIHGVHFPGGSYSDFVYFTYPKSQAGVIDTGNNIWIGDLRPCKPASPTCATTVLRQITNNIIHVFGQGPAGTIQPATSNLETITPAGS